MCSAMAHLPPEWKGAAECDGSREQSLVRAVGLGWDPLHCNLPHAIVGLCSTSTDRGAPHRTQQLGANPQVRRKP